MTGGGNRQSPNMTEPTTVYRCRTGPLPPEVFDTEPRFMTRDEIVRQYKDGARRLWRQACRAERIKRQLASDKRRVTTKSPSAL
jgi:hypothetical protein